MGLTCGNTAEHQVKERIANDLANHVITVKHADGLYRHWRCQKPGDSNLYFDIVTWPGCLCITGDMGEYMFQRTDDMVPFMRSACMSYSYAAEKCKAHDGRLTAFSEEIFDEYLREALEENPERADDIQSIRDCYANYEDPHDAIRAMYESQIWGGCDVPDCQGYTYHFLWCLHAIHWFCNRRADAEPPPVEAAG